MSFLRIHLITLPRWFASPATILGVVLGALLTDQMISIWYLIAAIIAGLLIQSYAHSWNSYHDYVLTGFDKGEPGQRSFEKIYTGGQSVISDGKATPTQVLVNALGWLLLSLVPIALLARSTTLWVFIPWAFAVLCAPWYSEAKKLWHPELPLGIGFATCAVWLGMASTGEILWWRGFLASIPFFLLFGGAAEFVDQAIDAPANWIRGGRSLGMLSAMNGTPLKWGLLFYLIVIFLAQTFLMQIGILPDATAITLLASIPFLVSALLIDEPTSMTQGIIWGLGGIFLYQVLLVAGVFLSS